MKKPNFSKIAMDIRKGVTKHSPEILTGLGIAGMVTTTVLAVKATPKALRLIEEAEDHGIGIASKEGDPDWRYRKLTKMETIKVAWKPYIPAAVTMTASIACLVGAQSVNARRNAALATAYQLSTTALNEYKEKVVEVVGEKKEKTIREKIAQDKVDKANMSSNEVVVVGDGEVLCMDAISGRLFKSDKETLRRIQNDLNARMIGGDNYISLTEFYNEIGLAPTSNSDDVGWSLFDSGQISMDFDSAITPDGKPCLVVDYLVRPKYDYNNFS